jgi:hypothetical protein
MGVVGGLGPLAPAGPGRGPGLAWLGWGCWGFVVERGWGGGVDCFTAFAMTAGGACWRWEVWRAGEAWGLRWAPGDGWGGCGGWAWLGVWGRRPQRVQGGALALLAWVGVLRV